MSGHKHDWHAELAVKEAIILVLTSLSSFVFYVLSLPKLYLWAGYLYSPDTALPPNIRAQREALAGQVGLGPSFFGQQPRQQGQQHSGGSSGGGGGGSAYMFRAGRGAAAPSSSAVAGGGSHGHTASDDAEAGGGSHTGPSAFAGKGHTLGSASESNNTTTTLTSGGAAAGLGSYLASFTRRGGEAAHNHDVTTTTTISGQPRGSGENRRLAMLAAAEQRAKAAADRGSPKAGPGNNSPTASTASSSSSAAGKAASSGGGVPPTGAAAGGGGGSGAKAHPTYAQVAAAGAPHSSSQPQSHTLTSGISRQPQGDDNNNYIDEDQLDESDFEADLLGIGGNSTGHASPSRTGPTKQRVTSNHSHQSPRGGRGPPSAPPPAAPSATFHDEDWEVNVAVLESMGFERDAATRALAKAGGDLEGAIAQLADDISPHV